MFRFRARTRLAVLLVVLVVGALLLAACGGGDDDDSEAEGDEEVATTSTTEEPATTTTLPPVIAPLTGLPDATGTSPTRAAVVVKVDNVPGDGRPPQAGIEVADIVYEEPVEGTHAPRRRVPLDDPAARRSGALDSLPRPRNRVAHRRHVRVLGRYRRQGRGDQGVADADRRRERAPAGGCAPSAIRSSARRTTCSR